MHSYPWARRGDINAFFGLMLDNVAVMIILVTTLAGTGLFTPTFVLTRMLPGTALGVLIGDLVYTWMAFRLARRTGNADVTAMPLGLDTPSTFGISFLVLIPARIWAEKEGGYSADDAMHFAWHVGMLTLVFSGVFKTLLAPFGNAVRAILPRAGLLGSLAAIALTLIAFLPLLLDGIAAVPLVGMVSLTLILVTLVAHRELPWRFPGALAAVLIGMLIYWVCYAVGGTWGVTLVTAPPDRIQITGWEPASLATFYAAPVEWLREVFTYTLGRLPLALPFALATIVGGIDCTESAASAGDEYDTRGILLTEGVASLVAGLLGGVIQTTPYIGHPAFKKMGGRSAYTLANALFIGVVGCVGGFGILYEYLPKGAMFPIFVFVGLEITAQSFHATPTRHYPAVALAMMPALAYLILLAINNMFGGVEPGSQEQIATLQTLRCLANGFLISGMLWAAAMAMIIDGRLRMAAGFFALAGLASLFGLIHSPLPAEQMGLPWHVLAQMRDVSPKFYQAVLSQTPYHWAGAYGLIALMLLGLELAGRPGDSSVTMGVNPDHGRA